MGIHGPRLALLLACTYIITVTAEAGCPAAGCTATYQPVCGQNGVTLMNECLAACQSITVAYRGPCNAEAPSQYAAAAAVGSAASAAGVQMHASAAVSPLFAASTSANRRIDAAAIQRFSGRGMVLVGALESSAVFKAQQPSIPPGWQNRRRSFPGAETLDTAVTSDGLVYMLGPAAAAAAAAAAAVTTAAQHDAAAVTTAAQSRRAFRESVRPRLPPSGKVDGFKPARPARAQQRSFNGAQTITSDAAAAAATTSNATPDMADAAASVLESTEPDVAATAAPAAESYAGGAATTAEPAGPAAAAAASAEPVAAEAAAQESETATSATGARHLLLTGQHTATAKEGSERRPCSASNSGRKLKTVFPQDERTEMTGPVAYPYSAVGMVTYYPDKAGILYHTCSGGMVGRFTVLTAAHCVVSRETKQVPQTWHFAAGQTSTSGALAQASATVFYFNSNYLTSADWWLWDMAVAVLDQPLGDAVGWLGYAWAQNGYTGGLVNANYPQDKTEGSLWVQGLSSCKVRYNGVGAYLSHTCDTAVGSSGSTMFQHVRESNGAVKYYVRAVHNAGNDVTNSAVAVNRFWAGFLQKYSGATPGQ